MYYIVLSRIRPRQFVCLRFPTVLKPFFVYKCFSHCFDIKWLNVDGTLYIQRKLRKLYGPVHEILVLVTCAIRRFSDIVF